jgi:asparagine synthase (glutamine-hydrolysing)
MCGLAGLFTTRALRGDPLRAAVERMRDTLAHRGPDDQGYWSDDEAGVAFGFRRLAIIDLTPAGHQPMRSASGRFTIAFNGEVFNHHALRAELVSAGHRFRGHSDTEVILAAFEAWGIRSAVPRFVGMFGMAVWDAQQRTLTLVRDRLGIKPVFVYAEPGYIAFGSELKALVAGPWFERTLDVGAVADVLRSLYVPGPGTIWARARKVPPGHLLTIHDAGAPLPEAEAYWSLAEVARRGLSDPFTGDDADVVDAVDAQLREAVRLRMEADVPLGALLSGGIDSSLVVALMQEQASSPVRTFSIGFDVAEHDEAAHAAAVAQHLGTDHTLVRMTGQDALAQVPAMAELYDEPHADASQLATLLVCQVARRDVTVALSGDGGDEIWGGYNRYRFAAGMAGRALGLPRVARRLVGSGLGALSPAAWDALHAGASRAVPALRRERLAGDKLHKLRGMLLAGDAAAAYGTLVDIWPDPDRVVPGAARRRGAVESRVAASWPPRLEDRLLLADQQVYLTDDQLVKTDRASMGASLELRVPLLDHRLVELSWRMPWRAKVRDGVSKWALRQSAYRRIPRALLERPKMGFTLPLGDWLRGPLRDWAEALLAPSALSRDGLLDPAPIRRDWAAVLEGRDPRALRCWSVLMLQAWRARWT